jgi:hypothetical protein
MRKVAIRAEKRGLRGRRIVGSSEWQCKLQLNYKANWLNLLTRTQGRVEKLSREEISSSPFNDGMCSTSGEIHSL